jgi:hypothetical protein
MPLQMTPPLARLMRQQLAAPEGQQAQPLMARQPRVLPVAQIWQRPPLA